MDDAVRPFTLSDGQQRDIGGGSSAASFWVRATMHLGQVALVLGMTRLPELGYRDTASARMTGATGKSPGHG